MILNKAKYGDKRVVTKFAWLPIYLSDGTAIWLQKYKAEQTYKAMWALTGYVPEWYTYHTWIE
jgi:hypothetical protein